jgi:hypothetical protein
MSVQGARRWRDQVIVGHWLADGEVSVHDPGEPCGLCEGAAATVPRPAPGRPRRRGLARAIRLALGAVGRRR